VQNVQINIIFFSFFNILDFTMMFNILTTSIVSSHNRNWSALSWTE